MIVARMVDGCCGRQVIWGEASNSGTKANADSRWEMIDSFRFVMGSQGGGLYST